MAEPQLLATQLAAVQAQYPLREITIGSHLWTFLDTDGAARGSGVPRRAGAMPLVLLPGAMGRADTSFEYILAFAPQRRVISLDYPPALAARAPLIEGLHAVLDALAVGPAAIVGGSYSGLVAQFYAAAYPSCVGALLLANSGAPDPAYARRWQWAATVLAPLPERLVHAVMHAAMGRFLPGSTPAHTFWRAYFAGAIPTLRKQAMLARLRLTAAMHAAAAELYRQPFTGPTLIVESAEDHLAPPAQQAVLHGLYAHARTVRLAAKGHVASLDAAKEYIAIYREFLCDLRLC